MREIKQGRIKILKPFFIFIIIVSIYTFIHELVHKYVAHLLGYGGHLEFSFLTWNYIFDVVPNNSKDILLTSLMPYLLDIALIIALLLLYYFYKNRSLFYLSIFPSLDIFINILAIPFANWAEKGNDFLYVIQLGFSFIVWIFAVILFFLVLVQIYIWFRFIRK